MLDDVNIGVRGTGDSGTGGAGTGGPSKDQIALEKQEAVVAQLKKDGADQTKIDAIRSNPL